MFILWEQTLKFYSTFNEHVLIYIGNAIRAETRDQYVHSSCFCLTQFLIMLLAHSSKFLLNKLLYEQINYKELIIQKKVLAYTSCNEYGYVDKNATYSKIILSHSFHFICVFACAFMLRIDFVLIMETLQRYFLRKCRIVRLLSMIFNIDSSM